MGVGTCGHHASLSCWSKSVPRTTLFPLWRVKSCFLKLCVAVLVLLGPQTKTFFGNHVWGNRVRMKSSEWALIRYAQCPYKKEKSGHQETHRENICRWGRQRSECLFFEPRKARFLLKHQKLGRKPGTDRPQRAQVSWHLGLRLLAYNYKRENFVVQNFAKHMVSISNPAMFSVVSILRSQD